MSSNSKHIYLAGAMTGLDYDEAGLWRDEMEQIFSQCKGAFTVFNPYTQDFTKRANALKKSKDDAEKMAMDWDLYNLHHSDVVIYNDNHRSTGSSIEIGIAHELGIPIVTLHENNNAEIHPWIKEMSLDVFDDSNELVSFIINNFQ